MKTEFEVKGIDNIVVKVTDIDGHAPGIILNCLEAGAFRIRNRIFRAMKRTPKTGHEYKRGAKWHIASSPGHAPARDRGELMSHIIVKSRMLEVEVGATAGAPYYRFLEEGTSRMAPRPSLMPAVEAVLPRIKNDIRRRFAGI